MAYGFTSTDSETGFPFAISVSEKTEIPMSELRTKMVTELAAAKSGLVDLLLLAQEQKNAYEACKKTTAPKSKERRAVYNVWYETAKERVPNQESLIRAYEARIEFFDSIHVDAMQKAASLLKDCGANQQVIAKFKKAIAPAEETENAK